MKNLILILIICVAFYFTGNAQSVRFGINAGAAFANYTTTIDGTKANDQTKTGFAAGILVDIPLGTGFSFQPGLNFVQKGTKEKDSDGSNTLNASLNVNHIEVPLNLVYNTGGGNGGFFIGAGPSIAYGLSGDWKVTDGTESYSEKIKFGSTESDDLRRLDMGANFLAGYRLNNGLTLSANYNLGLSNLIPVSDDGSIKSHYFGIKLGFLFGRTGKK